MKDLLKNRRFYKTFSRGKTEYKRRPGWQRNPIEVDSDGTVLVSLYPLKTGWRTRLDPEDYDRFKDCRFRACKLRKNGHRYAFIGCNKMNMRKNIEDRNLRLLLHDILIVPKYGHVVDHIVHDVENKICDNTRKNIREATYALNAQNCKISSRNVTGIKGVGHKGDTGYFIVTWHHKHKNMSLRNLDQCFTTLEDAALCRDYLNEIFKTAHPVNCPGQEIPQWIKDRVEYRLHEIGWRI